ncbi:MAG: FixH family protein [Planctomycetales bacterium]|nr:FixH family protein [Planctomycetales bacterium]
MTNSPHIAPARSEPLAGASTSLSGLELQRAERRARRVWLTVIVGLLGLQVAVGVTSVLLAVGDPSVAIVPNYHQAALDWDTAQRARQLPQRLGWQLTPSISDVESTASQRVVRVSIVGPKGEPITGLRISAQVYHHARGSMVYEMRLNEIEPGSYQAGTGLTAAGYWHLQLQIEGTQGLARLERDILVR